VGKWAINGIMAIVALTWATSIGVGMVNPAYTPPPTVHLAMMAIVGALFGRQVLGKAYGEEKRDDRKPPNMPGKRD
jgi:hypothetical protein